jgi:hypothetical protein
MPATKPIPFRVKRENGLVHVDRVIDAAFRQALLDGIPVSLRPKMREALAVIPDSRSRVHTQRYFGDELPEIMERIAPLLLELNKLLSERFNLPGLYDWLDVTGFGNDYRMVKAFDAWAQMKFPEKPALVVNA